MMIKLNNLWYNIIRQINSNLLRRSIMNKKNDTITKTVKTGITFGSALAMVISYVNWHSVGWAIVHGLMSWVYVIYYIIRY